MRFLFATRRLSLGTPALFGGHSFGGTVNGMVCGAYSRNARQLLVAPPRPCLRTNKATTSEEAARSQLRCPECGKRFLSAANLRQHRRSRHLVFLKSPSQEHLEQLRESNARLLSELKDLQEFNASKIRSAPSMPTTSPKGACEGGTHFTAALTEGRTVGISMEEVQHLRSHPFRLGTGTSEIWCIGVVVDDVELGVLGSADEGKDSGHVAGLETMQFTLLMEGYRQRRIGQLKMYRNHLTVRVIEPRCRPEKGDVVLVAGTYGLHKSYDLVSKQAVENAVVEALYVALIKKKGLSECN